MLAHYSLCSPVPMTIVFNDQRLGSTKNFEKAIRLCTGDIVALSDQDDVWRPHKLATIERLFGKDPDLGLMFSNADLIDHQGAVLRGDLWSRFWFGRKSQKYLNSPPDACNVLLSRYFITGATMAFRSSLRSVFLPIPDGISTFIHDRWIAVMISAVAGIACTTEKLVAYRLHAEQQMGVGNKPVLEHHLTPYSCSSDRMALEMMRQQLVNNSPDTVKCHFMSALDTRLRHLAVRAALHANFGRRLMGVAKEYVAGRYKSYPMGSADALKDLLVGTR